MGMRPMKKSGWRLVSFQEEHHQPKKSIINPRRASSTQEGNHAKILMGFYSTLLMVFYATLLILTLSSSLT